LKKSNSRLNTHHGNPYHNEKQDIINEFKTKSFNPLKIKSNTSENFRKSKNSTLESETKSKINHFDLLKIKFKSDANTKFTLKDLKQ